MVCPVCGGSQISAGYRTEDAVYLACADCPTAWAVPSRASESAMEALPSRQKPRHGPFPDEFDD